MKKFFLFLLFIFLLSGCSNSDKRSDLDILTELAKSITMPEEISENVEFKTTFEYDNYVIDAQWISNDESLLSNEGIIYQTNEYNYVSITVILSLNNTQFSKSFDITILPIDNSIVAAEILNILEIPLEINNHIKLDNFIKYKDTNYKVSWDSSNEEILSSQGKVTFDTIDRTVTLFASINYERTIYTKEFNIVVKSFDNSIIDELLNSLNIPKSLTSSIALPTSINWNSNTFSLIWKSNNTNILNNDGSLNIVTQDSNVILNVKISIDNVIYEKNFSIVVKKTDNENIINLINNLIKIPKIISNDYDLPTNLGNNLTGSWSSENENVISSMGIINKNLTLPTKTNLTFNIKIGDKDMTFNYETIIQPVKHFYMNNVFDGKKENLIINNKGKLSLADEKLSGTYYSNEIPTHKFSEAVATWCATSSTTATCELFVSLKVDGIYSDYITYGEWGFGLKNGSTDQNNGTIRLIDDEIKVLNNKYAEGVKFKLILKRQSINDVSPEVDLVTFALNLVNYTYEFDASLIKDSVKYDVPKLYQHDVPTIGDSICSITSSTMLLKFKGYNFTDKNPLEHQYMASLLYDYSNRIYGNWVFNCVGMSSFGERAYVKRFFNTNEFLYSIQEIGPMAASIKGTVKYTKISDNTSGSYTSAGHLLVVTGFEITDNQTYIFINDPNVRGVAIKMTLDDFLNIWRNVSYILE